MSKSGPNRRKPEWPTVFLIMICYGTWALATTWMSAFWLPLGFVFVTLSTALHSSLQHEVLHGHPFANRRLNEALVFPAIGLWIPFNRFRDLHLAHHTDATLTDPYDDPESNYLASADWDRQCRARRVIRRFNNTLLGRLMIGSLLGQIFFLRSEFAAMRARQPGVLLAWALLGFGLVPVLLWLAAFGQMPVWAFLLATYSGHSLIKIRTFLEHQAHDIPRARTVVVEDRGPLAFLFLNNNFHMVHHMHPRVAWYRLPRLYFQNKNRYLNRNDGYHYRSYGQVFRLYMLKSKDPVRHPLMRG